MSGVLLARAHPFGPLRCSGQALPPRTREGWGNLLRSLDLKRMGQTPKHTAKTGERSLFPRLSCPRYSCEN
jgi:hypothetical protein